MLFSKKPLEEIILILDVQSSVVRGSLVTMKEGTLPHVFFTYNADVPYKSDADSAYLIKTTLHAITVTIDAALRSIHDRNMAMHTHEKIRAIHFALSSPWIVSQAQVITMQFKKNTRITRDLIEGLIQKERAKLSSSDEPIRVIEEKIFDVRLNGYSVNAWENKETMSLEVSFTVSIAGSRMVDRFITEAARAVRKSRIYFHSSLLLQFMGVQKALHSSPDYTLMHMHGELTDIAIIRRYSCVHFGSFPFGVRTFIRRLSDTKGVDEHAADSLLTLYAEKRLEGSAEADAEKAISLVSTGWATELKKVFDNADLQLPAPVAILFSAWGHDSYFVAMLKSLYPKIPVTLLLLEDLLHEISFETPVERRRLTALYVIAIYSMESGHSSKK